MPASGSAEVADLRLEDFAVGEDYELDAGGATHRLELIEADSLPHSAREAGGFRLEFRGPWDPVLPQATYELRRGGETREIFIVPIGREAEGTRYEAVFY